MKVFITGASGYIGGSVAAALMAAGHRVSGLARSDDDCCGAGQPWRDAAARHA